MFPGGNAVNVPVYANRLGHPSSYIGWLGDDQYGDLIYQSLEEEGIDLTHCRRVNGENAFCEISIDKGERIFGNYSEGVRRLIQLSDKDLTFISTHDLTHTSIYSFIEPFLEKLSKASQKLSFDFSQDWDDDYLQKILPHVDIAILSSKTKRLDSNKDLMEWASSIGPEIVIMTAGEAGALVYNQQTFFKQAIIEVDNVVDTLGAGDAFAAQFMVDYLSGISISEALINAANFSAKTCTHFGAFGHGKQL